MNDDLTLLASAYLDGEATPDERARVEADPALLGEVERLRAARVTLLDATWFERPATKHARPPSRPPSARGMSLPAGCPTPAPRPRRPAADHTSGRSSGAARTPRWLGAAAALVAVAALGVVVAQSGGRSDDAETSSVAVEAPADTEAAGDASLRHRRRADRNNRPLPATPSEQPLPTTPAAPDLRPKPPNKRRARRPRRRPRPPRSPRPLPGTSRPHRPRSP